MNSNLTAYYHERAKEYDRLYERADRQAALSEASGILREIFRGQDVFEIAAGTGYWTEKIAETAASIHATDINQSVLDIARARLYPNANVTFQVADMYALSPTQKFDALFGGFIWSHILKEELDTFLSTLDKLVSAGGTMVFMDNRFVEGSSTPIAETDSNGNTYQDRKLENGTGHRVLKNFPSADFLRETLSGRAVNIRVLELEYYWILSYNTL